MYAHSGPSAAGLAVFTCSVLVLSGSLALLCVAADLPGNGEAASRHSDLHSLDKVVQNEGTRFSSFMSTPWYFCFEDKCRCRDEEADCSGNHGQLPFIPRLPAAIRTLRFSENSVKEIPQHFFANVTNISFLDLSQNELFVIHPKAFAVLRNVTALVLTQNTRLSYLKLHPVFSVPTLEYLDISYMDLGRLPSHFFYQFNFSQLRRLEMSGNGMISGNLTMFAKMENLQNLALASNHITQVSTEAVLKLQTMNLENNRLSVFPDSCKQNVSLFPNLNVLNLQINFISVIPSVVCLPELHFLDLSQNWISALYPDSFTRSSFPSLLMLNISLMSSMSYVEDDAFNNNGLETLSLAGNNLQIGGKTGLKQHSFRGCDNLTTMYLGGNFMGQVSVSEFQELFGVLPCLHTLDLSSVSMMNIPQFTSFFFPALQQLILRDNFIESLPDAVLNETKTLTMLDLSKNVIQTIHESTFSEATRNCLQHLDLSGNLFICSCELVWFQQWYVSQPSQFNPSHDNYTCTYQPASYFGSGTIPLASFHMNEQACLLSSLDYIMIIVFASYVFVISIACIVTKFVYNLVKRPLLIRAFGGRRNRVQFAANDNYVYDIFVAYAEGDSEWVRGHLVPKLEGQAGLKLCLHERDFHPGQNILYNIENNLQRSRRALMIFSTHFANSRWCQFELGLCQRHVMDNEDVMLVVCVEEVQPREWTTDMMAIILTSTYLHWPEGARDRDRFWGIMLHSLQDFHRHNGPQA